MFKYSFPSSPKFRKNYYKKVLPNEIRQDFFYFISFGFGSFVGIGLFVSMRILHKLLLGM